jgi:hypothetical protein
MDNGNPKLRNLSPGQARRLCKSDLMNDPKAQERYQEYDRNERDIAATYNSSYRAVERGGRKSE